MLKPIIKSLNAWHYAAILSLLIGGYLLFSLLGSNKGIYLIGKTTDGHHQIEMACEACHTQAFGSDSSMQKACVDCHGEELKQVEDSHAKSVFNDPRNADQLEIIDARLCVACHKEHKSEITVAMGSTQPDDFCVYCHEDIAEERPSHADFEFKGCAASGCHNYHDNTALYEDFLLKHRRGRDIQTNARVENRNMARIMRVLAKKAPRRLYRTNRDVPETVQYDPSILRQWASTAHARGGVNCSGCHQAQSPEQRAEGQRPPWQDRPDHQACRQCHEDEVNGFLAGKHGMRLAVGLTALQPSMARLPMKQDAEDKIHGCVSCHADHDFDTRKAAVESCLACHDDEHSLAYKRSPHFRLWKAELQGRGQKGSGVSCATCHLPREPHRQEGLNRIKVQHNQNKNLEPNEKMIRSVCMDCHGLRFSIDSLADSGLIKNNFSGRPLRHVESIDMAQKRLWEDQRKKNRK